MRDRRHKWGKKGCDFWDKSTPRGTTFRGKKDHFLLLDRYVQRIDALVPEDMEHLVRPLSWVPPQQWSRTLKLMLSEQVEGGAENVTEADVREFLAPLEPAFVEIGWWGHMGGMEVYVQFETAEECQEGRLYDGRELGGAPIEIRFSDDAKFQKVQTRLAHNRELGLKPYERVWVERGEQVAREGDSADDKTDEMEPPSSELDDRGGHVDKMEPPSVSETVSSES